LTGRQGRNLALAIAICLIAVLGAAGCGSSSSDTTSGTEAASGSEATSGAESSGGESGALAGISPPSGSTLLDSKSRNGVVYEHYSTGKSPSQVESTYKQKLTSAGWSIESSGGSGGAGARMAGPTTASPQSAKTNTSTSRPAARTTAPATSRSAPPTEKAPATTATN